MGVGIQFDSNDLSELRDQSFLFLSKIMFLKKTKKKIPKLFQWISVITVSCMPSSNNGDKGH